MAKATEGQVRKESEAERRARHAHEDALDLVRDSTTSDGHGGYTRGREVCDLARMAIARPASRRTPADWDAIGRCEDPPSGVTGLPHWETRGHSGS